MQFANRDEQKNVFFFSRFGLKTGMDFTETVVGKTGCENEYEG